MKITGHKTLSVYQRYRIVNERDLESAPLQTQAALGQRKERRVVPIAEAKEASRCTPPAQFPHNLPRNRADRALFLPACLCKWLKNLVSTAGVEPAT